MGFLGYNNSAVIKDSPDPIGKSEKAHIKGINNQISLLKRDELISSAGEISDGYHTFNELYHHRAVLFASLCLLFPEEYCWKSKLHEDGTMFDGMFIVGIKTAEGYATYHYDIDPYWDMFYVKELDRAPEFDGHTPEIALNRIYNFSKIISIKNSVINLQYREDF